MKKINCFGDVCPVPLEKAQKEMKNMGSGESFMLIADRSCVVENLEAYFADKDYSLNITEAIKGVWEITITKN